MAVCPALASVTYEEMCEKQPDMNRYFPNVYRANQSELEERVTTRGGA